MKKAALIISSLLISSISTISFANNQYKVELGHQLINKSGNEIHVLTIPSSYHVRPIVQRPGKTVKDYVINEQAVAGINGGFFNYSDGYPVSFVIVNGYLHENPENNKDLINNPALKPILSKILYKRAEIRQIEKDDKRQWLITHHSDPLAEGFSLVNSLQGGPNLLPEPDLEGEGFIIKNARGEVIRDGIGSLSKAARSAVGIDKEGNIVFIAVASKGKGHGMTMKQLSQLVKELKLDSAMALDGGRSTTLVWHHDNQLNTFIGKGNELAPVNSALLVFK